MTLGGVDARRRRGRDPGDAAARHGRRPRRGPRRRHRHRAHAGAARRGRRPRAPARDPGPAQGRGAGPRRPDRQPAGCTASPRQRRQPHLGAWPGETLRIESRGSSRPRATGSRPARRNRGPSAPSELTRRARSAAARQRHERGAAEPPPRRPRPAGRTSPLAPRRRAVSRLPRLRLPTLRVKPTLPSASPPTRATPTSWSRLLGLAGLIVVRGPAHEGVAVSFLSPAVRRGPWRLGAPRPLPEHGRPVRPVPQGQADRPSGWSRSWSSG